MNRYFGKFLISINFLLSSVYSHAITNNPVIFSQKMPDASVSMPLVYWFEKRDIPRPIKIHFLRIDLQNPDYEIFTIISDDPDGNGPANAKLEEPEKLAAKHNALIAVNANAFQSLKDRKTETDTNWFVDKPIRITGLAISNGVVRNKFSGNHFSFWIDFDGKPHFGIPDAIDQVKNAVSDWSGYLVHKNKVIVTSREKLHPRTLLGLDKSNQWLFLAVIEGRQPEISEGINIYESAVLMKSIGCNEAIALDGGGSSIMLVKDMASDKLRIVNNPFGEKPRPVPVMLGVRAKTSPR
ncbi:MAG: phosphodiester glycosidase family protein [Kiritimatiellae bacterium]|nr:phosphodiester glycosidase family protein [Kiritimatiellia bacterium]MDD5520711.1 phosphodiester glycosidase family protein [Kiritimatiellia bacterium]